MFHNVSSVTVNRRLLLPPVWSGSLKLERNYGSE